MKTENCKTHLALNSPFMLSSSNCNKVLIRKLKYLILPNNNKKTHIANIFAPIYCVHFWQEIVFFFFFFSLYNWCYVSMPFVLCEETLLSHKSFWFWSFINFCFSSNHLNPLKVYWSSRFNQKLTARESIERSSFWLQALLKFNLNVSESSVRLWLFFNI